MSRHARWTDSISAWEKPLRCMPTMFTPRGVRWSISMVMYGGTSCVTPVSPPSMQILPSVTKWWTRCGR